MADPAAVGALAAELLVNRLVARPCRVLLPTGETPLPFYSALRERAAAGRIAPGRCEVLQLDEYCGLTPGHPHSFRAYLQRELRSSGLRLIETFNPEEADLGREAARYQQVLDRAEIDIAVLGLGLDGHVASDEPGSGAGSGARVVALTAQTRALAAAAFGGMANVPKHALTVGVRTLLEARELVLLVTGERKAEILHAALSGPPRTDVPASLLRLHPRLTVICDEAAGSRLRPSAGSRSDHVLVVLGHCDPDSRIHRASHQSFARLRVAAGIGRSSPVRACVITGFNTTGGLSEAEQMAEEWSVVDVPAVLEVAGRDTIDNAVRSLPLIQALGNVRRVTVVTSAWHLRARRAFRSYRHAGFSVRMAYDWSEGPWLRMLARELVLIVRATMSRM
jgi:glucosamine-6-phosphate deaminase